MALCRGPVTLWALPPGWLAPRPCPAAARLGLSLPTQQVRSLHHQGPAGEPPRLPHSSCPASTARGHQVCSASPAPEVAPGWPATLPGDTMCGSCLRPLRKHSSQFLDIPTASGWLLTLTASMEEVRRGILSSNLTSSISSPTARDPGKGREALDSGCCAHSQAEAEVLVPGPSPDAGPSPPLFSKGTHGDG